MIDQRYSGGERGNDCPYSWLNEWLCEYVDGTMDPSVRAVFEEYLTANPELAEHVEQLCRTRSLLCECERRRTTPDVSELRSRLREEATPEAQEGRFRSIRAERSRPSFATAAGSAMLALAVGMVIGATFLAAETSPIQRGTDRPTAPSTRVERPAESLSETAPPARIFLTRRTAPAPITRMPALQLVGKRRAAGQIALSSAPAIDSMRSAP